MDKDFSASSRFFRRGNLSITTYVVDNLDRLSEADTQNALLIAYYEEVLTQAKRGYLFAQIVAIIGMFFLLASVVFVLVQFPQNAAIISLIAGALNEFLAAVTFVIFGKTSQQFYNFHERLNAAQRFQKMSRMIESMEGEKNKEARLELIKALMELGGKRKE